MRVLLVLFVVAASPVHAASSAAEFGASRFPTEPSLEFSSDPAVCKEVLGIAKEAFLSQTGELDVPSAAAKSLPPLEWRPISASRPNVGVLELDLDATGRKQVVVYRDNEFNWKGNWHYAYVFETREVFNAAALDIKLKWGATPDVQYPSPRERHLGGVQYYPGGMGGDGVGYDTGNVWAGHNLFRYGNRYYFFQGANEHDRRSGPMDVKVFRLRANGQVERTCRITMPAHPAAYQRFLSSPGVGSYLAILARIGGGGPDCGTAHFGAIHDSRGDAAQFRAAGRPWAVSIATKSLFRDEAPYYVYDARTRAMLAEWSEQEIWTRREYQTLLAHEKPAAAGIETYLQREFGLAPAQAKRKAEEVLGEIAGARMLLHSGYTPGGGDYQFYVPAVVRAVIRRDAGALQAALKDERTTAERITEALAQSVEWPAGMETLIRAGADVNGGNAWGKTALMVAAHMNRPDAVRTLLAAGAKVNAQTNAGRGVCSYPEAPGRGQRTALMYAAENASPVVIRLLLDAGADPAARDSKGNGVDFYLALNPRLTPEERAGGVTGIAARAAEFDRPGFDCAKAASATERRICGSEPLRILDGELGRAFQAAHARFGKALLTEQRGWLAARNEACAGAEAAVDCLAEVTRTRVRYLHNRLAER